MRRAAFWFPNNPYPPAAGAHRRCVSLLESLRDLGWSVSLLSSTFSVDPWTPASVAAIEGSLATDVRVYDGSRADRAVQAAATRWSTLRARAGWPVLESWSAVTPALRSWARRQMQLIDPDLIVVSYAQFDSLVPHSAAGQTVIDAVDLVAVSQAMFRKLSPFLRKQAPFVTGDVPDEVLSERFLADIQRSMSPQEMKIYDRYTDTVAISAVDEARIAACTSTTRVSCIPMTCAPLDVDNGYDGPALFVGGANPFNLQGMLWFAKRVLPRVRTDAPDFTVDLVGRAFAPWVPDEGIVDRGYVADLLPLYRSARFAVCPLLAGTGQQVKIVDAMARGVPVIATPLTASSSPIVDGENGFVAATAEEFSDRVATLWRDQALCRSLGLAARETIANEFSPSRTTAELGAILR